jgi:hypothetical protein
MQRCKRQDGTERAWFASEAEAIAFSKNPQNPAYHGDVAHACEKCNGFHLSRPEWLRAQKTCPACSAQVAVLITDCATGKRFCHHCSGNVAPNFLPHFVMTIDDVVLMRSMGIDPEISGIEKFLQENDPDAAEALKRGLEMPNSPHPGR